MEENKIIFSNARVYFENVEVVLFTANTFFFLYEEVFSSKKLIEEQNKIFRQVCLRFSANQKKLITFDLLNKINFLGIGDISKLAMEKNTAIYNIKNTLFAKSNRCEKTLEFILGNIIGNTLGYKLKKDVSIVINSKNRIEKTLIAKIGKDDEVTGEELKFSKIDQSFKFNSLLKRVIVNKHIKNFGGETKIWNFKIFILPREIFEGKLIKSSNRIQTKFFDVGVAQGMSAYGSMVKIFGNSNREKIMKNIVFQSELVGFGVIVIKNDDKKNDEVILHFSKDFFDDNGTLNLYGYYSVGLTIGVLDEMFTNNYDYEFLGEGEILFKKSLDSKKRSKKIKEYAREINLSNKFKY